MSRLLVAAPIALILTHCAVTAHAFKLQAWESGSAAQAVKGMDRQMLAFMGQFTVDIHERITRQAYDMAGVKLPEDVLSGVRWNDNPPALRASALLGGCLGQTLKPSEGFECWTGMLRVDRFALETLTMRENTLPPWRSHFGDMQFLHAMAGRSGETAEETRRNILRWSEFAYRVARGEIEAKERVSGLRRANSPLDDETAAWLENLFGGPSKKHWTVRDIFLPRSGSIRLKAFGSLLHVVEDSYSASHVRRQSSRVQANGCLTYDAADPIVQFQTFVGQDTEKHGVCDDAPDWLDTPRAGSPADVIAEVVRAYEENHDWPVMRAILENKVFRLADSARAAEPGACFEWRLTESVATTSVERVVAIKCEPVP